ncbi:hypothetical protein EYZ11_013320 [Aspergillus tanneri]|uniref:Retrovirus-related Pol polyprotein from transposon TNT 1-94-like beta-barrel domain-containing protein n=1 Tax=Aspergillus tanneri TaxID=1220188 RepID=A0A4S3IY20_9EURO|nr:hypothetical protein EYZ11_013320 [Aspergillus tanneri]
MTGCGTVRLSDAHYNKITLQNVLYVPGLSANLVFIRVLCERGLQGIIAEKGILFYRNRTLVLQAIIENNLYIIKWFLLNIAECAYTTQEISDLLELGPHAHRDKKEKEMYNL